MQRILIIGGGFAGVWAARAAARARRELAPRPSDLSITLVSRDPYLTIRPRLYEPAPERLRVPLDQALAGQGVERMEGEVTELDIAALTVSVAGAGGERRLAYDRLVLAAGSRLFRPTVPGAGEHAFSVDTHADAMALDRHLSTLAARPVGPGRFTAIVVGSGFTGLEVATELVARLRALAGAAHATEVRVVLVERADTVAPDLGPEPRPLVERALRELDIALHLGTSVAEVRPDGVRLLGGEWIPALTTVWAGGLRASDLTAQLGGERDALGRVTVDAALRVEGVEHVIAAGDVARAKADATHATLMSCQHAIPMGEVAGRNAVAGIVGAPMVRFAQPHYVTCLDLGPWGALFTQGWERTVTLTGFWAKAMKETINTRLIYPPIDAAVGDDAEAPRRCGRAA